VSPGQRATAVGRKADPAGTGTNGGKAVWKEGAQVPDTMAAHRMSREVSALRIGAELGLGEIEYLEGIEPAPLLPVEAERPSIRRGDEMAPRFGCVSCGLAGRFDTGAVQAQKQRRPLRRPLTPTPHPRLAGCAAVLCFLGRGRGVSGGQDCKVLHAAIDVA